MASGHAENAGLITNEAAMKKEIYITILLFAFMLFALISTVVRGDSITA